MKEKPAPFEPYGYPDNNDGSKKISDELIYQYKGKILEIYIGDQYETINLDDVSVPQNCVMIGRLDDVLDRFLVLDCFYVDKRTKEVKIGNRIYINTFQIRAFTEVDEGGSLGDVFLSVDDTKRIKKHFHNLKK